MNAKTCERCGRPAIVSLRFCRGCRGFVLRQMHRSGYLQTAAEVQGPRPDTHLADHPLSNGYAEDDPGFEDVVRVLEDQAVDPAAAAAAKLMKGGRP